MSEISPERKYYIRASLMYTDMTRDVLLKVFRFLIKTEDIAAFLSSPDQQKELWELRKRNILNEADHNLISGHVLNIDRIDISLLIRLILNLCEDEITKPQFGWNSKPQPHYESLGADLLRLRDVRNKIFGHRADAKLSEAEYEHIWQKVKAILLRAVQYIDPDYIEGFERRLDEYKQLDIDNEDSRIKKLMTELLDYKKEIDILQERVKELTARSKDSEGSSSFGNNEEATEELVSCEMDEIPQTSYTNNKEDHENSEKRVDFEPSNKCAREDADDEKYIDFVRGYEEDNTTNDIHTGQHVDDKVENVSSYGATVMDVETITSSLKSTDIREVEELAARSNELQVYLKTTPERYVRYIKLLFEGGRKVLCGILQRELGDQKLPDLLVKYQGTLKKSIEENFISCLFPEDADNFDHRTWDIYLLASVLLLVFNEELKQNEIKGVKLIKTARMNYANCAISSLDTDEFLMIWSDLIVCLKDLSISLAEENRLEVEYLIELYKRKDDGGGNAEEYFQQLRESGIEVKTIDDVYNEIVAQLRDVLKQPSEKGVKFKQEHVLEMKMLTTCENEEMKKKAEDLLEINLQASLRGSAYQYEPIGIETDKFAASIAANPYVKPADKRENVLKIKKTYLSEKDVIQD